MVWEFVQGLGALVGLATGCFVLAERLTKHRPEMFFIAAPFMDVPGANRFFFLRVKNTSPRPILIRVANGARNGELLIAKDNSSRAIITSVLQGESVMVVNGEDNADFPLLKPPDFDELDRESEMVLIVDWQFAQPILLRGWRRRRISMSKRAYLALGDIEDIDDDDD